MNGKTTHLAAEARRRYRSTLSFLQLYWKRGLVIAVVLFIVAKKDIDVDLQLSSGALTESTGSWFDFSGITSSVSSLLSFNDTQDQGFISYQNEQPLNTSVLNRDKKNGAVQLTTNAKRDDDNLANTFSNLTFSGGAFATSESTRAREAKRRKQNRYVRKYADIARLEMDKYGIPASITLAQGLLESNAGESALANRNNNHFGIKCFSRSCKKGHCSNFTDDHHKDFFRIYRNPEDSFRSHSNLLQAKRYRRLFKLDPSDYRKWAHGLKKAGYATDKYYAEKLINLIEELGLDRYDY